VTFNIPIPVKGFSNKFLNRLKQPEKLRAKAKKSFETYDKNNNGEIDRTELKELCKQFANSWEDEEELADEFLKDFDINKDGKCDIHE
jgi:Ca2+-binding EF-hand superfamily protein